jgi:ketosteroid isomerase-like protein
MPSLFRSMRCASLSLVIAVASASVLGGCIVVAKTESRRTVVQSGAGASSLSDAEERELLGAVRRFLGAWTKVAGTPFTTDALAATVDQKSFVSFDGMSPHKTVITSWNDYAAIWGPGMNAFTTANLSLSQTLAMGMQDDMAYWAGLVRIQGVMPSGEVMDMPGHMTLILHKHDNAADGVWKVAHEHMSLGVKK